MLDAISEYLLQTATWTPVGVAWYTPSERGYHLGVAHGLPGVIALLAQLRPFDMASGIVDRILEPAVHYLLSTARKSGKGPRFPSSLELAWPMPRSPVRPGLAWCWGDLGIAATLALAGRVVREDTWMNEAVRIALRAARMSIPASDVLDMALCHGAAGIALIFNRFFQTTGNEVFQDASQRWYNRLLNSRRPEFRGGYATLLPSDGPHGKVWAVNPGFLSGLAGIGLSLCAACTETAPSWDRLMLLSSVHDDGTGLTWRAPTP